MTSIEPVTVLHGHTSPETAYLVEDYPYGYRLRCQIRYWLDTAAKGAKKGQTRLMSQTTDPKHGDVWNKPKAGLYSRLLWLVREPDGHTGTRGVGEIGVRPEDHARLVLEGVLDQITDADRRLYAHLLQRTQTYRDPWDRWNETVAAIREHHAAHGELPELDDRSCIGDTYIGTHIYPIACAWVLSGRTETF